MGEVIDLASKREAKEAREAKPQRWCCDCGCITFYHWSNGAVQCADCKLMRKGLDAPPLPQE